MSKHRVHVVGTTEDNEPAWGTLYEGGNFLDAFHIFKTFKYDKGTTTIRWEWDRDEDD